MHEDGQCPVCGQEMPITNRVSMWYVFSCPDHPLTSAYWMLPSNIERVLKRRSNIFPEIEALHELQEVLNAL